MTVADTSPQAKRALELAIIGAFFLPGSAAHVATAFSTATRRLHASDVQRIWEAAKARGDLFAIIDGQHHAAGALLRGLDSVPCAICKADLAAQAAAFVSINGSVTAMTPLQLHAARLAAGDPGAAELAAVCAEADVTICRYPVPANKIRQGETLAVSMLQGLFKRFGREVLVAALSCITKTRRGNPGMIRAQIVEALCAVLEAEPDWHADRARLIFAMQTFDFTAQFNAARTAAIENGSKVSDVLVDAIGAHLEGQFAERAA